LVLTNIISCSKGSITLLRRLSLKRKNGLSEKSDPA